MVRRFCAALVCLSVAAASSTAIDLTVGASYHTFFLAERELYESVDSGEIPIVTVTPGDEVDFSATFVTACVSVFADLTYAVAGVELAFPIPAARWTSVSINGALDEQQIIDTGYAINDLSFLYLDGYLYGKYPIDLGFVSVFPLAGIQFAFNLQYEDAGTDVRSLMTEPEELNDWFLVAGVGADFFIGSFVIRPSFLYGYNLTPGVSERGADEYSGSRIYVGVGFGYRF